VAGGRPILAEAVPLSAGEAKIFAEAVKLAQRRYPPPDASVERKPVVSIVLPSQNQFADAYAANQSVLIDRICREFS
jgi:hypothetical protein